MRLAAMIPSDVRARIEVVSESGIAERVDIERLARAGVHAALVAESLLTASDPRGQLRRLLGG